MSKKQQPIIRSINREEPIINEEKAAELLKNAPPQKRISVENKSTKEKEQAYMLYIPANIHTRAKIASVTMPDYSLKSFINEAILEKLEKEGY